MIHFTFLCQVCLSELPLQIYVAWKVKVKEIKKEEKNEEVERIIMGQVHLTFCLLCS